MEIQFLGTSSGTPTKHRNVSAVAVVESRGSDWYLVDCGEGTQHQLLKSNLSLNTLGAIFITHIHGDHCYGLPGLLASAGMNGRRAPLKIVAPKGVKEWFEATQVHTQLFLPYELEFVLTEALVELALGQFTVSVTELSHRVPSFAYSFTDASVEASLDVKKLMQRGVPKGPLWGKLRAGEVVEYDGGVFNGADFVSYDNKPRKVIVCGDNDKPELLTAQCQDCDVLIHEATYTEDVAVKVGDVGHSYAKQVAQFSQQQVIAHLILTHFSPRYQLGDGASASICDVSDEASRYFSGALFLAEDFMRFRLDKAGCLTLLNT